MTPNFHLQRCPKQLDPLIAYFIVACVLSFLVSLFLSIQNSFIAIASGLLNFFGYYIFSSVKKDIEEILIFEDNIISFSRELQRSPAPYKVWIIVFLWVGLIKSETKIFIETLNFVFSNFFRRNI